MRYFIICLLLLTQGCVSNLVVPDELVKASNDCQTRIAKVQVEEARTRSIVGIQVYKDETAGLLSQAISALTATNDPFRVCNDPLVNYIQAQGRLSAANAQTLGRLVGITGIIGGIYATGQATEDLVNAGGSSDTTVNAVGSRVSFAGGSVGSSNGGLPGGSGGSGTTGGTDISQSSSGDLMPLTMDNIAITSGNQSYSNTRPQASTSYNPIINAAPGEQNITQQELGAPNNNATGDGAVIQPAVEPMTLEECWAGGGCGAGY